MKEKNIEENEMKALLFEVRTKKGLRLEFVLRQVTPSSLAQKYWSLTRTLHPSPVQFYCTTSVGPASTHKTSPTRCNQARV